MFVFGVNTGITTLLPDLIAKILPYLFIVSIAVVALIFDFGLVNLQSDIILLTVVNISSVCKFSLT